MGQYKGPEMEMRLAHLRSINNVYVFGVGHRVSEVELEIIECTAYIINAKDFCVIHNVMGSL